MRKCAQCGGRLRRIHRTFGERLRYMALYECRDCKAVGSSPRRWSLHTGSACRCPICGTYRVTRLKAPDKIDRHHHGLLNLMERIAGGRRYHCRFCRVQFFDRRPLLSELQEVSEQTQSDGVPVEATTQPDTARLGE